MFEGLRKPTELIVIVVTLLAYGCPIQVIVHAFGLDERTVESPARSSRKARSTRASSPHPTRAMGCQHVQIDEMRVKGRGMIVGMGLALLVSTRLWLAGVVSVHRDRRLADRLLQQVQACCQPRHSILVCTDGWSAYPGSMRRAFREKVKRTAGWGRACLQVWPQVCIATVIKRTEKKRVVEVLRAMTLGTLEQVNKLLQAP